MDRMLDYGSCDESSTLSEDSLDNGRMGEWLKPVVLKTTSPKGLLSSNLSSSSKNLVVQQSEQPLKKEDLCAKQDFLFFSLPYSSIVRTLA